MKNTFKDDDKEKFVKFLNMVAKHAKLEFSVQESIEFVKLLTHMQQEILPKINNHVLEVKKVVEPKKDF